MSQDEEERPFYKRLQDTVDSFAEMYGLATEELKAGRTEVHREYRGFAIYICKLTCAIDVGAIAEEFGMTVDDLLLELRKMRKWFGEDVGRQMVLSKVLEQLWSNEVALAEGVEDEWDEEDQEWLEEWFPEED